jgi:uncharacterized protein (TIGR03086 family)
MVCPDRTDEIAAARPSPRASDHRTEEPNVIDLTPATTEVARIVGGVTDEQLAAATPCTELEVADLLDHLGGLCTAFAMAARKEAGTAGTSASFDGSRLADGWRDEIPAALADLAEAWRDPSAWDGMTAAGGIEMPGEIGGLVALDEVVVHGWDLARATGQDYAPPDDAVTALHEFVASWVSDDAPEDSPFGPPRAVPAGAPVLDRLVGLTGRDPGWPSSS